MEDQKQRVYDALNKLNIKYEVVEHEPVHTMEDMDRLGLPAKGTLCKNLFLRDAKGKRHFLVTCDEKKTVDLKSLGRALGAGNLSFASEERLEQYLGLKQGSVSPFGLMNDADHAVEFLLTRISDGAKVSEYIRWKTPRLYSCPSKTWTSFSGIWMWMS